MGGFNIAIFLAMMYIGQSMVQSKIWSFAIGHDWGAHEYIDTDGYMRGFGFDIIDQVCTEGAMDCRIIWDKYSNCWKSDPAVHPSAGRGIFGRWYDGCTGWVPTIERIHSLSFTYPYLEEGGSYFYFLIGKTFNANDLSGYRIGFLDGWAYNEQCLARQTNIRNSKLRPDQIKVVPNPADGIKLLEDGGADAIFGGEDTWTTEMRQKLEASGSAVRCFLGGWGIFARKDSGLVAAWNVGFTKLKDNNRYAKFCKEWGEKHSHKGKIPCNI